MPRLFLALAAAGGFFALLLGAFAAHGLEGQVSAVRLNAFKTGAEYQMTHSLALMLVSVLMHTQGKNTWLRWAAGALTLGLTLFCGSLYILVIFDVPAAGMVTPLGGLSLALGWLCLFLCALDTRKGSSR